MNTWAIVEIFGHQKFVGYLTECEIGGGKLLRLDVPECDTHKSFTKFFGNAAIYSVTPVDEDVARSVAQSYRQSPVSAYDFGQEVRDAIQVSRQKAIEHSVQEEIDDACDDDQGYDDPEGVF